MIKSTKQRAEKEDSHDTHKMCIPVKLYEELLGDFSSLNHALKEAKEDLRSQEKPTQPNWERFFYALIIIQAMLLIVNIYRALHA